MFGAGKGWAVGGGGGLSFTLITTHFFPSLPQRDDAPFLLLLGILATETQKKMKEEEELKK